MGLQKNSNVIIFGQLLNQIGLLFIPVTLEVPHELALLKLKPSMHVHTYLPTYLPTYLAAIKIKALFCQNQNRFFVSYCAEIKINLSKE